LYHELERGYCSISNATFAEWYNCTKDTVSRTISELVNAELIAIECVRPRFIVTLR
jgi:DNA-binding GntR family transcriptional regulator